MVVTSFVGVGPVAPRAVLAGRFVEHPLVRIASDALPAAAQLLLDHLIKSENQFNLFKRPNYAGRSDWMRHAPASLNRMKLFFLIRFELVGLYIKTSVWCRL